MNLTTEFFDQQPALNYIKDRGYASYSSLKNYRDGIVPSIINAKWLKFGKELHSRFLEKKVIEILSDAEELVLAAMIKALEENAIVSKLMKRVAVESEFKEKLYGVPTLGYIDILGKGYVADLKSTSINNGDKFIESMDFLQAALYLAITGFKDFYYIGISKQSPYNVMVYNVRDYPERIKAAEKELKQLLTELKWLL